ncbi:hypothetical protein K4Q40_09205 [Staphylococcus epidermidis]|nr:hypothetical protein [Staphylococcus epidermidis]MCG2494399.1 hypothetical protein [Staphylococcus epidermidis]UIK43201.1 hypothetical protein J4Z29_001602 [Staphylococcus epidermidis]
MKKVINILLIAILSVVLVGLVLIGIRFAKDIWSSNDSKTFNNSHQGTSKKNTKSNQDNNNVNNSSSVDTSGNNNSSQDYNSQNNMSYQTENHEESSQKKNFDQNAVNQSLDKAAQNLEQFDEDGDGRIGDSERTTTTDLLESQDRLTIYSDDKSEEE